MSVWRILAVGDDGVEGGAVVQVVEMTGDSIRVVVFLDGATGVITVVDVWAFVFSCVASLARDLVK
jgi:hypothetical protein